MENPVCICFQLQQHNLGHEVLQAREAPGTRPTRTGGCPASAGKPRSGLNHTQCKPTPVPSGCLVPCKRDRPSSDVSSDRYLVRQRNAVFAKLSKVRSSKETLLLPTQHLLTYKPSASSLWMIKTKVPSFLFRPSQDQKCNSFPKTPAQLFLSLKPHKGRTINQSHLFLLPACAQAHRSTCHLTRSATTREIDGRSLVFPEVLW